LARTRERKQRGEEKIPVDPNHHTSVYTRGTNRKFTVRCFKHRPGGLGWGLGDTTLDKHATRRA